MAKPRRSSRKQTGQPTRQRGNPAASSASVPRRNEGLPPRLQGSITVRQETYSGALPSPEILARFQVLIPDAPERFMRKFEQQVDHRHAIERQWITTQLGLASRGQIFAFILFIAIFLAAVVLGLKGDNVLAITFIASDVFGGVGVFVTGKIVQTKERGRRARILAGDED